MTKVPDYERGMTQVGPTTYSFLQPDGGWGWSNAGLVVGDRESILIDTFFDLPNTRELLDGVRHVTDRPITTLVNTHHNADHTWGNQLVEDATIVGHAECRREFLQGPTPELFGAILSSPDDEGAVGYMKRAFAPFDVSGIELRAPQITFDDSLSLFLGDREVCLYYYGPGHTLGDVVAWVPDERVLFAGDLLFLGSTPLVWQGSLANWVTAVDSMLALEPETVVPGHGPVTSPDGLREMQAYLQHVIAEGARLRDKGLPPLEAAREADLGPWAEWTDSERIALNMMRLYLELDGQPAHTPIEPLEAFGAMAAIQAERSV